MKTPATYDLTIYKGDDFEEIIEFQESGGSAMDLTGWTARSQIRKKQERTADLVVDFTVTIPTPTDGKVYLTLTDTETGAITVEDGHYDILLTNASNFDETYVIGDVTFMPTVTVKT